MPPEKAGMGSGINTTFRQVGIATGVAGLGAIFQSRIASKLSELLPTRPAASASSSPPAARARRRRSLTPAQRPESSTPPKSPSSAASTRSS